jgi:predicted nucleic acid-binding protein
MTLVIDASAVVDAICRLGEGRRVLDTVDHATAVFAPAHVDAEALSAMGRLERAGDLSSADDRIADLREFPAERLPLPLLLPLAWSLKARIALKDALYVALALTLDASLLTTDRRLARAIEGLVPLA